MFERITTSNHTALSYIKPLYENTFPIHERRTWEALMKIVNDPKLFLNVITEDGEFIGFINYWKLDEWLYLEHFVIEPAFRGKQHGTKLIQHLLAQEKRELILETEPPTDEITRRRIRFYEKQGLKLLPYPYKQPPYRKEEEPFKMMLMATSEIHKNGYEEMVDLIRSEVYERFY